MAGAVGAKSSGSYVVHRARRAVAPAHQREHLDQQFQLKTAEAVAEAVGSLKASELERAREVWRKKFEGPAADAAGRVVLESEGVALARARRAVMKRLIEREPARALAVTVPADVRARLPAPVVVIVIPSTVTLLSSCPMPRILNW